MTARLVLLTGPAAEEVAQVFRDMCNGQMSLSGPTGVCGVRPKWDEVRDYSAAPIAICQASAEGDWTGEGPTCCDRVEAAIRSLPGGEAWLVGLVLPETAIRSAWAANYARGYKIDGAIQRADREQNGLPARLAILAPEPPPLLVERVRAWGGEVWFCSIDQDKYDQTCQCIDVKGFRYGEMSWPEAVRAALGGDA